MDGDKLSEFLSKRDSRVTTIEIANTLYQTLGKEHLDKLPLQSTLNPFEAGCVFQYFAFTQKILVDFIFMNFITVIGSYNVKNDSLKAWTTISFTDESERNNVMTQLKEIRARYADPRNNFICHINDEIQQSSASVLTKQISHDVASLRSIFNIIRQSNSLPIVVSLSDPIDHYSVNGLKNIFSILSSKSNMPIEIEVT
ncbi:TPA: hypothetical protein JBD48_15285 [Legionella pneumophila subsp. pneumophila]|nr:hypothetical protein [Legionella pneumophila subsp. pneumophila]